MRWSGNVEWEGLYQSVSQVLSRQGPEFAGADELPDCGGHIVTVPVSKVHQGSQCRPVGLRAEARVHLVGQGSPLAARRGPGVRKASLDVAGLLHSILRAGARIAVPRDDGVCELICDCRHRQVQGGRERVHVAGPGMGGSGHRDQDGLAQRIDVPEVCQSLLDEDLTEWSGCRQGASESRRTAVGEHVGRVGAFVEGRGHGIEPVLSQEPIVALSGDPSRGVGVGGNDDGSSELGDLSGLFFGQGRPERSDADVPAGRRDGDGPRVEWPFDEDQRRIGDVQLGCEPEELGALVEERGVGSVEVLGTGCSVVRCGGVATTDEPEDVAVVKDGHDGPVAEAVDESARAGSGGDSGLCHLLVGDSQSPEVGDQVGPAGGGVARIQAGDARRVLAWVCPLALRSWPWWVIESVAQRKADRMSETTRKPVRGQAQNARQTARRAALDAQAKLRQQRVEKEKRVGARGVEVMVALGQRDEAVRRCEERAGEALRVMTDEEGLSLDAALEWCGDGLSRREAARLRALASDRKPQPES